MGIAVWYNIVIMVKEQTYKKRCPAMKEAGITDPDSAEGILFCAGDRNTESSCPYPKCIVFEYTMKELLQMRAYSRAKVAKEYNKYGVSVEDIALIMSLSESTVERYLKRL